MKTTLHIVCGDTIGGSYMHASLQLKRLTALTDEDRDDWRARVEEHFERIYGDRPAQVVVYVEETV